FKRTISHTSLSPSAPGLWCGRRDSSLSPLYSPKHQTLSPLVAGSCRNSILPAQRSKVSPFQRPQSKLDSLLHRFTLFPWHAEVLTSPHHSKSVTYVLNLLCIRCPEPAPQPPYSKRREQGLPATDEVVPNALGLDSRCHIPLVVPALIRLQPYHGPPPRAARSSKSTLHALHSSTGI